MARPDLVAIGASAGGVEALRAVAAGLPTGLPAAVLVVLHLPRDAPSALPNILQRSGPLPAAAAVDGELLQPGRIYVAPPDVHMLVIDGRILLGRGPSENGHRPAIDPLFRSVARAAGPRGIAVVLSGARDDGAAGATSVARAGGTVIVQDPADALFDAMPVAVLARHPAAYTVTAAALGDLLVKLTAATISGGAEHVGHERPDLEAAAAQQGGFGCPTCGGSLTEVESDPAPRFRCRIGHAWSAESLLAEQAVTTEGALWTAVRALEEKAALAARMASHRVGRPEYLTQAQQDAQDAAKLVRDLIDRLAGSTATQEE
jgi:two-component system chemotaxis response regulator CheB